MMEFKTITSVKDPYFKEALQIYDAKLDISLTEDSHIFKQSLENNKTEKDYAFIVGIENNEVISMATAHYEATTNSAFLIYLITKNKDNHDEVMSMTLDKIEEQLNVYANEIHDRNINFIMMEVPKEPLTTDEETNKVLERRRQFLYEQYCLIQRYLRYKCEV